AADFAAGTGEPNDPYQIATVEQLIAIGSDSDLLDKNFVLVADIDLDPNLPGGRVFTNALIARDEGDGVGGHSGASFDGVLDGQGHTIANLHIEGVHGYDAGLFGKLSGLVKDLRLTDVVISGSPCGAIAGLNHRGMILRCQVTGRISGANRVGGLVGDNWDASLVECRAKVQVTGEDNVGGMVGGGPGGTLMRCHVQAEVNGERSVGGLVGGSHRGQIIECQATGVVIGGNDVGGLIGDSDETMIWRSSAICEVIAEQTAGGLVGDAHWHSGLVVADCYARGSVAGSVVGGLAGDARHNQFLNCYAACEVIPLQVEGEEPLVGGLFGEVRVPAWAPLTVACFWDAELSGIAESAGSDPVELGTGLTTEQMRDQNMLRDAGWDFSHVWMMCEGDYPRLRWEAQDCGDL
ncbi:MAG: hypothetical protein U9Q07_09070, partial [Planctomycetota bacterium]|nr:hypothetical protein [Planctomycetota bacterium]